MRVMDISAEELARLRYREVISKDDETSLGHPKCWAKHLERIAERVRNGPQPSVMVAYEHLYLEEPPR